jgi:hydrogenase-4 membrane subunit HyfE
MTLPLILCLVATVIPVFFSRLSATPAWLSIQALTLVWITVLGVESMSVHAIISVVEIIVIRVVLVPYLLARAIHETPQARMNVMPSNLFAWGVAITLIILAFKFGDGARADFRALTLGVVAATAMIAFLILATNREPAAQLVAVLFMENALALFESLMPESWPIPVHLAVSGVYVLTVMVGSWLVRGLCATVQFRESKEETL